MLLLPNGCKCGKISVHPKNWKQAGALTSIQWYISYRFYDPVNGKKQITIKGMNDLEDLKQRQDLTADLLSQEIELLTNYEYNPITRYSLKEQQAAEPEPDYIIHPDTPFIQAITEAIRYLRGEPNTIQVATSVVKYISAAAKDLNLHDRPVSKISRRHIIAMLKRCEETKKEWSDNLFNTYRANLMMIFKKLIELETVESNPITDIIKRKKVKRIRERLTLQQRRLVNDHLKVRDYRFWNYMHLFFYSGGRTAEIFRLKGKDVDLVNQRYKCLIKKRGQPTEEWKAIRDISLEHWQFAMAGCDPEDYVFSRLLKPGPKKIRADQISKRWYYKVKKELGITADFYSMKASNLDEVAAALDIKDSSVLASHTTPVITMDVYATGEKWRQQQRIKKVQNPFISEAVL